MSELSKATIGGAPPSADFNPRNREKRQDFIRDTFSHERQWSANKWKRVRAGAQNMVAFRFHTSGFSWLSSSSFDYAVDFLAWLEYHNLSGLEESGLRWPWDPEEINIWELEEGISEPYKNWLEAHGHQAGTPQDPKGRGDFDPYKLREFLTARSQLSAKPPKPPAQIQDGPSNSRRPQSLKPSPNQCGPSATSRGPQLPQKQGSSPTTPSGSSKPFSKQRTTSSVSEKSCSSQPTTRVLVAESSPAATAKWRALEEDFGRRFNTTLAKLRHDGFIDGEPTIRWGVMLPLRDTYRPAFKLDEAPPRLPDRNFRQHIWDMLDLPRPVDPYTGPFEVAIPPWIDFFDLLFGEQGTMFDTIGGLIPRGVSVAWNKGRDGVPSSLVVGPNPIFAHDIDSPPLRDGVQKVWRQVIQWLALAQAGRPLHFTDFLRCFGSLKLGEDKSTTKLMDELFRAREAASRSPMDAHTTAAKVMKNNLIRWSPEIHAHLKMPSSHAGVLLKDWVLELGPLLARERADAVFDVWGKHSPKEASLWFNGLPLAARLAV
ncbi:hypothetical protein FIE12Z_5237 [Fusarium flagelliforme]|uniref:Uncharacterized protein n=1 Tax=Fusarium flagelliforme TaxID=2675880 RepID=A0A395MR96_9HYPO|nr:hypothetical protein FIE12Z_5237 [Fusarium flagelliforme]